MSFWNKSLVIEYANLFFANHEVKKESLLLEREKKKIMLVASASASLQFLKFRRK